ncbi:Peptidase A1 domain-containing protein [Mycena chlorophos]|uniref:Peptidase A1 domain-containing protein n=1 Tax=Mycena chlorophos TaxID=658473 RepID=A0A8H6SY68_MYCCL|nr:Peptidase A1 domain-containing protein [Mycena chlorophos]
MLSPPTPTMAADTSSPSTPTSDSLRFSLIKRKPAPTETSTLFPTDHAQDDAAGGFLYDYGLPHIPSLSASFSAETEAFWKSLDTSGAEMEFKSRPQLRMRSATTPGDRSRSHVSLPIPPIQRSRAHSLPSRRFSKLVRIPPPKLDSELLAAAATIHGRPVSDSGMVLPASPSSHKPPALVVTVSQPQTTTPRAPKRTTRRFGSSLQAHRYTISSPQQLDRQYSAASSASQVSLSSFPLPPASIPPVPPLPSPFQTASRSFILEVDPPLGSHFAAPASEPNLVAENGPSPAGGKGKAPVVAAPDLEGRDHVYFDFGAPEGDGFDQTRLPTVQELEEAAELPVISESGVRVAFGRLFEERKTVVCFIRHFWCPLCQDYMFSISRNVSPQVLSSSEVDLVIISNGSWEMIKAYRRIFQTPFQVFTDPTHRVYNALGMTLQTLEKGPKGDYIRHGTASGIGMVVANAVKVGMPVWKQGGEISQLGGEFVLGPGLTCSWAHRMRYTRNHVPILKVLLAAGIDMRIPLTRQESSTGSSFLGVPKEREKEWMKKRRSLLKKIRSKKLERRGGVDYAMETASTATSFSSNSSPANSNRSSMISEISVSTFASMGESSAPNMCSWDPAVEEAINVGLSERDMDAIQEVEEEERVASMVSADSKSEHTDYDAVSETESSATEPESPEGQALVVEVSFEPTMDKVSEESAGDDDDDESEQDVLDLRPDPMRDSWNSESTFGSGLDIVVSSHKAALEFTTEHETVEMALSQSGFGIDYP